MSNFALLLRGLALVLALLHSNIGRATVEGPSAPESCAKDLSSTSPFFEPRAQVNDQGRVSLQLTGRENWSARVLNRVAVSALRPLIRVPTIESVLERLLELNAEASRHPETAGGYFQRLREAFQISVQFDSAELSYVPRQGPVLVTVNHPLSGPDLVVVAELIERVRPDVRIVSRDLLEVVPGFADHALFINPTPGVQSRRENWARRELILQALRRGEVLVIAPAGAVSVKENLNDLEAQDPEWKLGVADFIRQVPETSVVSAYVGGQPSQLFHLAKRVHPVLSTAMIVREIANQVGQTVSVRLASPLGPEYLQAFRKGRDLMQALRDRTYSLASRGSR